MNILFAPDWRQGVPYQRLLAEALEAARRPCRASSAATTSACCRSPACFGTNARTDLLHLHWPEAYYPQMHDRWDKFRRARFVVDLMLATWRLRFRPDLTVIAQSLRTQPGASALCARVNYATACRRANLIFAHSTAAANQPRGDLWRGGQERKDPHRPARRSFRRHAASYSPRLKHALPVGTSSRTDLA